MTAICLDTSAYSYFKRGDAAVVAIVRAAKIIHVPTIVLGELRTGFRLGKRADRNERELQAFLDHPVVSVACVDATTASIYAGLIVALRKSGTPVPTNDAWIAAVGQRHGAPVVTYDAHFATMAGVDARILRVPGMPGGS